MTGVLNKIEIPNYTRGEEIFNMTSHIVGGAVGIAATVLCVVFAALHGSVYGVVSGAVYGAMMIVLYSMSSIYHGLHADLKAKKVFRILDHCAIFLLIAAMPAGGLWLLLCGGIAYTAGAVLYAAGKKHAYIHSVFHLFVLAGSILHFLCILLYVI